MTLTEKLLARASGKASVQAGDNIWVNADVLMTHDVCGPGTIGVFKREFGNNAKVWDRDRVVIIPDHYIFTADSKSNRNVDILRDFAREQDLPYFYDVIDDPNGHWQFDSSSVDRVPSWVVSSLFQSKSEGDSEWMMSKVNRARTELREMSSDQLGAELAAAKTELFQLRIQASTEKLDAPSNIRRLRRQIARIKTIVHQRDLMAKQA